MVFKEQSVRERLKRLEEVIGRLSRHRGRPLEEYLGDVEKQWFVERGFILAAECIVDISSHILSGKFGIQPMDHEDAIRKMGQEGIISDSLTGRLRGLGGFRNLLVHDYLKIDAARVHEYLNGHLDTLRDFATEVTVWLERGISS